LRTGEEKVKNKMMIEAEKEEKNCGCSCSHRFMSFSFVPEKDNFFAQKGGENKEGLFLACEAS
jgi:hypothetical protein